MTEQSARSQAARLSVVEKKLEAMEAALRASEAQSKETHDAVARMESALFRPAPGHDKPLIDRFASATTRIEGAGTTLTALFWLAAGVAAIGAALTFFRSNGG